MIPIRILIMLLIIVRSAKIETTKERLKRLIKEKSCSKYLLQEYLELENKTDILFKPIKASKEIKNICPSIQYTCCSLKQVQYLKDRVLSLNTFRDDLYKLARGVGLSFKKADIDKEAIKKMIDENPGMTSPKNCENLDKYFDMVENIEDITKIEYDKVHNSFVLIMSSFGCQICNYTFKTKLDLKEDDKFRLRFNFDNIKLITKELEPLDRIADVFHGLKTILVLYYELNGIKIDKGAFKHYYRLTQRMDFLKDCSLLSQEDFVLSKDCQEVYKKEANLRYYDNIDTMFNVYYEAIETLDDLLKFRGKLTEAGKYDMKKDLYIEVFPHPKNHNTLPLNRFYTERVGIAIKGNEMNLENSAMMMMVISIACLLMNQV